MQVRDGFNYDRDAVSAETGIVCAADEDKTQQQFREDADINTIVRRFGVTGKVPGNVSIPMTGDFTQIGSFHDAMNLIRQAEGEFMKLPAEVRRRFDNDPGAVVQFMADERNREEAIKLGLIKAPPEKDREGNVVGGVSSAPQGS